jgi:hypothetical protein
MDVVGITETEIMMMMTDLDGHRIKGMPQIFQKVTWHLK